MPTSIAPTSHWALNEASGSALDGHTGANDLTEQNGAIATGTGILSGARDLESSQSRFFRKADPANLRAGNDSFSVAGWINIESRSGDNSFLGKWDGGVGAEYILFLGGGVSMNWSVQQAVGGVITVSPDLVGDGVWHFIAAWHDAENNQMGASVNDGTPVTAAVDGSGIVSGTVPFDLGGVNASSFFDGLIDEWAWYPGVLTSGDRTFLFNGGAGRTLSEILGGRTFLLTRF